MNHITQLHITPFDTKKQWTLLAVLGCAMIIILGICGCKKDYEVVNADPIKQPFDHKVTFNYNYDISGMNAPLNNNLFTADMVIYFSDHLNMTWPEMQAEFKTADASFRKVGVQLHLLKAVNVSFPNEWNNQVAYALRKIPDSGQVLGFYDKYAVMKPLIRETVKTAFTDFTYDEPNKDRTIFIVPMSDIKIIYAEQNAGGIWQIGGPVATGALSFPGYLMLDGIPKDLRGCITMQSSSGITLAHELGHKLINVSHEGLNVGPAFSGNTIPGLLGYGNSTSIYGGQAGRWHQERLLLSPYLYKINSGDKIYNPDYTNVGAYTDPIYGNYIMPQ